MKRFYRTKKLIAMEIVIFLMMMTILWVDEFLDLPYHLFGASPTPYRIEEYLIETISLAFIGLVTITGTFLIQKRMNQLASFLKVCAWCKKISVGDTWIEFEEYMSQEYSLESSHGICPDCFRKARREIQNTFV